jgi:hypothetical protein
MPEIEIKYRLGESHPPHPPQQIKLELPGWSGENHKHCDGTRAQPWQIGRASCRERVLRDV